MKEKWGIRAGNTGWLKMDDVEVPGDNLLGRPGEGFKIAMSALDQGRFTVAAGATGLIRACRDASVTYAKERRTFGVEIQSCAVDGDEHGFPRAGQSDSAAPAVYRRPPRRQP